MGKLLIISLILFLFSCHNSPKVEKYLTERNQRINKINREHRNKDLTKQEYEFLLEAEKDLKQIKELANE